MGGGEDRTYRSPPPVVFVRKMLRRSSFRPTFVHNNVSHCFSTTSPLSLTVSPQRLHCVPLFLHNVSTVSHCFSTTSPLCPTVPTICIIVTPTCDEQQFCCSIYFLFRTKSLLEECWRRLPVMRREGSGFRGLVGHLFSFAHDLMSLCVVFVFLVCQSLKTKKKQPRRWCRRGLTQMTTA